MQFGKSKIFWWLCVSFLVGVFLGRYVSVYAMAAAARGFIMLGSLGWGRRRLMLVCFLGLALVAGAWRWQQSFAVERADDFVGRLQGQKVELQGVIVREPDIRDDKTNLTVGSIVDLSRPSGTLPTPGEGNNLKGNVLLSVGRSLTYQYGDVVKFSGKLQAPFESEEFSYKNYLSRYDTYGVMYYPKLEKTESGRGNHAKAALLVVKHKFQDIISAELPVPHDSLMLGLILGLKRSLPADLADAFIAVGVTHIIVVSGYNISIITRNILKGRPWMGRRAAFWLSLFLVAGFVVMTGAEASAVRAAVMGLLVVLALNVGRIYDIRAALMFTAAIMVGLNPKIIAYDIGFQLSFLAMSGLIYLSPIFERWFARLPDKLGLRTNLCSSLAAIIFTLPLQIYYFERLSFIAVFVNVLVLWVIPYAMFFGFFTALVGAVYLPLGHFLAGPAWLALEYVIRVAKFFALLPGASGAGQASIPWMAAYYFVLLLWIWLYRRTRQFRDYLEYRAVAKKPPVS